MADSQSMEIARSGQRHLFHLIVCASVPSLRTLTETQVVFSTWPTDSLAGFGYARNKP